ncbi:hypothetical protein NDU88_007651 [Pleurodeles waltl]|uniref:Uncharacterized protein n=1 Tax=Pleurodeles waltl TaxID=8319 RepID=A0AAV7N7I0_PLEWA|nr:hypothetical protein NDU88_007651 [Pleurodeles waltl]
MTYDAEGVINIRREDGRERSGKKKEELRTRGSRSEEIAIGASEEERETAVTGEPTTEGETAITRGPEEEKDTGEAGESVTARGSTAIRVPGTEEETQKPLHEAQSNAQEKPIQCASHNGIALHYWNCRSCVPGGVVWQELT